MVRQGPAADDGTSVWLLSMMLWYRIWVVSLLVIAPIAVGAAVYLAAGPFWGISATAIVGLLAGEYTVKISPKYDVTRNY